jgi:hypothetical protein
MRHVTHQSSASKQWRRHCADGWGADGRLYFTVTCSNFTAKQGSLDFPVWADLARFLSTKWTPTQMSSNLKKPVGVCGNASRHPLNPLAIRPDPVCKSWLDFWPGCFRGWCKYDSECKRSTVHWLDQKFLGFLALLRELFSGSLSAVLHPYMIVEWLFFCIPHGMFNVEKACQKGRVKQILLINLSRDVVLRWIVVISNSRLSPNKNVSRALRNFAQTPRWQACESLGRDAVMKRKESRF